MFAQRISALPIDLCVIMHLADVTDGAAKSSNSLKSFSLRQVYQQHEAAQGYEAC